MRRALAYFAVAALVVVQSAAAVPPAVSISVAGPAGQGGWYVGDVTITFTVGGSPPLTLTGNCTVVPTTVITLSGNTPGADVSCRADNPEGFDAAGRTIRIDRDPPTISGGPLSRPPDSGGWYNHPVAGSFSGSDVGPSGLAGCTGGSYAGPDTPSAVLTGVCVDNAGNQSPPASSGPFAYDATPPSVTGGPTRNPDANGWYTRPIEVGASGSDATSGLAGCTGGSYSGPDSPSAGVGVSCRDNAGNTASGSVTIPYDATAPTVTGFRAARPPDSGEWYTRPVAFTFEGQDGGGSGVESCATIEYRGPDDATATVRGTCRDKVGHTSAPKAFSFKYDATAPKLAKLSVKRGNGKATLSWNVSADTAVIEVKRRPGKGAEAETVVFRQKAARFTDTGLENGKRYDYVVTALDAALNADQRTAAVVPLPALYRPARGERVRRAPLLQWLPVPKATYYNAQLWFKGRKIMSMWPLKPFLQLRRTWAFGGRNHRLRPGVYRWYVWPGFGRKVQRRYGKLVGSSSFVVTR
jgi:hypothetical protein